MHVHVYTAAKKVNNTTVRIPAKNAMVYLF